MEEKQTLALRAQVLTLGKAKKIIVFFCFSLTYSYLWAYSPKLLTFGKTKKNVVFLCFSLT